MSHSDPMKIILLIFSLMICSTVAVLAQENPYAPEDLYEDDPYFWSYTREIGVNFTPLVSKLVPFNLGENKAGNVGLIWKKYYSQRAFRISLGAKLKEFTPDNSGFLFFGIGLDKRFPLSKDKKFSYSSGWELFVQGTESGDEDVLALRKLYGFEYHFSKRIFLSTEGALNLGLDMDAGGIFFQFSLPTAVFVNIRLY